MISLSELKSVLRYDHEAGEFTNIARRGSRALAGSIAGTVRPNGYKVIKIGRVNYYAHRLAWFYHHGYWPKQIDHINHDRLDNRISNLREAVQSKNAKNMTLRKANKTGIMGVYWRKDKRKWNARIRVNYKWIHLGYTEDFFEACCLRKSAERKYGFHPNHGLPEKEKENASGSATRS